MITLVGGQLPKLTPEPAENQEWLDVFEKAALRAGAKTMEEKIRNSREEAPNKTGAERIEQYRELSQRVEQEYPSEISPEDRGYTLFMGLALVAAGICLIAYRGPVKQLVRNKLQEYRTTASEPGAPVRN